MATPQDPVPPIGQGGRRPLWVGIFLPTLSGIPPGMTRGWGDHLTLARAAEAVGADAIWVRDELHCRYPDASPMSWWEYWTFLSATAAATKRIGVGTLVSCTNCRNPALLAKRCRSASRRPRPARSSSSDGSWRGWRTAPEQPDQSGRITAIVSSGGRTRGMERETGIEPATSSLEVGVMLIGKGPTVLGEFLDMQAEVGITKHIGGLKATKDLLALCRIEDAGEILEVGCGIGVGPAFIARTYDCHVVGVDASERMLEWSRQRAREDGVESRVEFRVADVLALPFEDGRFDVVFCESVLAFVGDKGRAIREMVRVTKPGGHVGMNEGLFLENPPDDVARVAHEMGIAEILTAPVWRALWAGSGLQDRVVKLRRVDPRVEVRSRIRWIGLRWIARAWARGLRLYLTDPRVRHSFKVTASGGKALEWTAYGLFAGRR